MAPTPGWKGKYRSLDHAAVVRRFVEDGESAIRIARALSVKSAAIGRILRDAGVDTQRGWRLRPGATTKRCPQCSRELPFAEFDQIVRRSERGQRSERPEPRGYCKQCQYGYSFDRNLRRCGLTLAQFESLAVKQDHRCAICGATDNVEGRRLAVDHHHASRVIRGLLCDPCNTKVANVETGHTATVDAVVALYIETAHTPYRWNDREHNARVDLDALKPPA